MKEKAVVLAIVLLALLVLSPASAQSPDMHFLADVTIPDDTVIGAGDVFTKTWKLENTGGVDWVDYSLQFVSGDEMSGVPDNVAPIETQGVADVNVVFTAPEQNGTYESWWALVDKNGTRVGRQFYVRIIVGTKEPQQEKPFILPFKDSPGPDTWLLGQPYGNTTGAYRQRNRTYVRSGGIHFGVDLSAPCSTEVTAIADGVVFAVDYMNFGSPPHNLMIDHPEEEYASFYGHLLETPDLDVGQAVKQGKVIGLSGDSAGSTCRGRPHLHLEIRNLEHFRKYNPATLVEADWDNLALTASFGIDFEYNLDNPRQWQHIEDQPQASIGDPILNDFENPWPPDWRTQR